MHNLNILYNTRKKKGEYAHKMMQKGYENMVITYTKCILRKIHKNIE